MTLEEFGQTIKKKYPVYNDMDDFELGRRMLDKYPVYRDMVADDKRVGNIEMLKQMRDQMPQELRNQPITKQIGSVLEGIPNTLLETIFSAEKGFGESIAHAIVAPKVAKAQQKSTQRGIDLQTKLLNAYQTATDPKKKESLKKELIRQGVDLKGRTGVEKLAEVAPSVKKTKLQIVGEAAGVAVDILSAGQYGKYVKGAKSFRLLKGVVPAAAIAAKGARTGVQAFLRGAAAEAPQRLIGGAVSAGAFALQEGEKGAEVGKRAVTGGIFNVVLGGLMEGVSARTQFSAPAKAKALQQKAIVRYKKALGATKEKYKIKAGKIAPELMDRNWWGTRQNLLKKAEEGIKLSAKEYAKIGELQGVIEIDGLMGAILKEMDGYLRPDGTIKSIHKTRYKALEGLLDDIGGVSEIVDGIIVANKQRLRELGAEFGDDLYNTRKSLKTVQEGKTSQQIFKVDSAIREILNSDNIDYAKVNKLNHLSKELQSVLEETAERKAPQKWISLIKSVWFQAGATAGIATGSLEKAVGLGIVGLVLNTILESSWFNTLTAKNQWRIANKLLQLSQSRRVELLRLMSLKGVSAVENIIRK